MPWLSAVEFADEAGISPQAARRALRDALAGGSWRGTALRVRWRHGVGGSAGQRLEVDLASLPPELRARASHEPVPACDDRVVNQRRNDRKAYADAQPRIRRDWTQLAPMERVIADVKHLDVIVRLDDGSTAWPKIVAFMDAGTGRLFAYRPWALMAEARLA